MYKVFFNYKTIFIADKVEFSNLPQNTLVFSYNNDFDLEVLIQKAENQDQNINYLILNPNPVQVFEEFSKHFKVIEAAGGKIYNTNNQFLGIFRREKWDLPKGKIDKGETIEEAAIRECREETGLISIEIDKKIGETYHSYSQKKRILKKTHWFSMKLKIDEPARPEIEEDITEIKWFDNNEYHDFSNNTFPSILEIV